MLAILGDLHLASSKDYFIKAAEDFIKWMGDWDLNSEENELLLTGDLVTYAVNGGLVYNFLYRIVTISKFKKIHIVLGNHDEKMKDGIYQLSYSFLKYVPKVHIYDKITIVDIQGLHVLLLPFYASRGFQKTMRERYSSLYKEKKYQQHFDLLVGHFSSNDVSFASSDTVDNLDKLDVDKICLGHIHKRINPDIYIGSVYATKVNENAKDRAVWVLSKDHFEERPLPNFLEFINVSYPSDLPKSDALTPVYTITNCGSDKIAKNRYGNIFIKSTIKGISSSDAYGENFNSADLLNIDVKDAFTEFLKSSTPPVDRRVAMTCLSLVQGGTNSNDEFIRNKKTAIL